MLSLFQWSAGVAVLLLVSTTAPAAEDRPNDKGPPFSRFGPGGSRGFQGFPDWDGRQGRFSRPTPSEEKSDDKKMTEEPRRPFPGFFGRPPDREEMATPKPPDRPAARDDNSRDRFWAAAWRGGSSSSSRWRPSASRGSSHSPWGRGFSGHGWRGGFGFGHHSSHRHGWHGRGWGFGSGHGLAGHFGHHRGPSFRFGHHHHHRGPASWSSHRPSHGRSFGWSRGSSHGSSSRFGAHGGFAGWHGRSFPGRGFGPPWARSGRGGDGPHPFWSRGSSSRSGPPSWRGGPPSRSDDRRSPPSPPRGAGSGDVDRRLDQLIREVEELRQQNRR
jgi:hypothetical protein